MTAAMLNDKDLLELIEARVRELRGLTAAAITDLEDVEAVTRQLVTALRKIADGGAGAHRIATDVLNRYPEWDRAWR